MSGKQILGEVPERCGTDRLLGGQVLVNGRDDDPSYGPIRPDPPISGLDGSAFTARRSRPAMSPPSDESVIDPAWSSASVVETHISLLFFVGDRVFKLRKPVNLGIP